MAKPLYTLLLTTETEETELHFTDYELLLSSKAALLGEHIPGLTVTEKPATHMSFERAASAVDYARLWASSTGVEVDEAVEEQPAHEPETFKAEGTRADQIMKLLARPEGVSLAEGSELLGILPASVGALISVTTRKRSKQVQLSEGRYRLVRATPRRGSGANTSATGRETRSSMH